MISKEQPLEQNNSCLLGSIYLVNYVRDPFTKDARFDFDQFKKDIPIFNRMLDNVVELANLPFENQTRELLRKRRHGIGFLGLGSTFSLLGIKYGSPDSVELTERISYTLAYESLSIGVDLAIEKGPAPIMNEEFTVTAEMKFKNSKIPFDVGDVVTGKELLIYSDYLQRFPEELLEKIRIHGMRYSHATSIAPTGTMALGIGNNTSNGIEPTIEHEVIRNVIVTGKKTKEATTVYSYEALLFRKMFGNDVPLPDYFSTINTITPLDHISVQAAAQPWIDSSISKTINCPQDISFEEFSKIYLLAHEKGLKSATTFRYNPEAFQGVIVNKDDLKNTKYKITLDDGSSMTLTGDELINYDDNSTTVANLYDAIKEGTYNKF